MRKEIKRKSGKQIRVRFTELFLPFLFSLNFHCHSYRCDFFSSNAERNEMNEGENEKRERKERKKGKQFIFSISQTSK